jgi:hypothetical protein
MIIKIKDGQVNNKGYIFDRINEHFDKGVFTKQNRNKTIKGLLDD